MLSLEKMGETFVLNSQSFSVIVVEFTKLILQLFASIFSLEDLCYVAERGETCLDVSK